MLSNNQAQYVDYVINALTKKEKHNKTSLEKIARGYGIQDQNHVKELTELAIVMRARYLAHEPEKSIKEKFNNIVELYNNQVNLSHRTSQSILLQQYSTPSPIGFLMGLFCGIDHSGSYYEPSAGNGLLTVYGNTKDFIVNEIDETRNENLKSQDFRQVTQIDGSQKQPYGRVFDAIITNPPFGKLPRPVPVGGFKLADLDHLMSVYALDCLKDSGKAAIIIGGHTTWDAQGRIQAGKNRIYFSYLYSHYNVLDVLLIDGHKLYSRQGTAFNTRLILIDGRKPVPGGYAPLYRPETDHAITSFEELYERVTSHLNNNNGLDLEAQALALELELLNI